MSRPTWSNGPLYQFMLKIFPNHRTILLRLDVEQLAGELGKSQEAIYKWLRKSRLTPENADALLALANASDNAVARGGETLERRDFDAFVYANAA